MPAPKGPHRGIRECFAAQQKIPNALPSSSGGNNNGRVPRQTPEKAGSGSLWQFSHGRFQRTS